jgi:hypothetical protein
MHAENGTEYCLVRYRKLRQHDMYVDYPEPSASTTLITPCGRCWKIFHTTYLEKSFLYSDIGRCQHCQLCISDSFVRCLSIGVDAELTEKYVRQAETELDEWTEV